MQEITKDRRVYIDVLRTIACFLVIVNHTNSRIFLGTGPSPAWFASLAYFFVSKTAVPIFLMISGALLLVKCDTYKTTFRRILRIVCALVVFSIVYFLYGYLRGDNVFDISLLAGSIYRTGITNAFWYLYLYIGVLVMAPILQRLVKNLTGRDFGYIFFWSFVFLGLMPILIHYVPALQYNSSFSLPLFSAYIGLLLMGYFIENRSSEKKHPAMAVIILITLVAVSVILTYAEYKSSPDNYLFFDNRLLITITGSSACLFLIVKSVCARINFGESAKKALAVLGRCTFGIYLLSDLGIGILEPFYDSLCGTISVFPAMIVYELSVFLCGLAVTLILTKIPFINRII